jgi:anti-anti-sigma factor
MSKGNELTRTLDSRHFTVRSERTGEDERVRLLGEMDMSVTGSVDREMHRAESGDAARIVLDLEELEFLDASGVRLLLHLNARSERNGRRLRVARSRSRHVQRVMELTGAAQVLPFLD